MKKILVIDDEFDVREMLQDFLTLNNYEVLTAGDGQEGYDLYQKFLPDLAIIDVKMPVLDGPGCSRRILADEPDFPIIIISGYLEQYNAQEIYDIGVKAILNKPLILNELSKHINEHI